MYFIILSFVLKFILNCVSMKMCKIVYHAFIESLLKYGIVIWGNTADIVKIFRLKKKKRRRKFFENHDQS